MSETRSTKCPECTGPVSWLDETHGECDYCGHPLERLAAALPAPVVPAAEEKSNVRQVIPFVGTAKGTQQAVLRRLRNKPNNIVAERILVPGWIGSARGESTWVAEVGRRKGDRMIWTQERGDLAKTWSDRCVVDAADGPVKDAAKEAATRGLDAVPETRELLADATILETSLSFRRARAAMVGIIEQLQQEQCDEQAKTLAGRSGQVRKLHVTTDVPSTDLEPVLLPAWRVVAHRASKQSEYHVPDELPSAPKEPTRRRSGSGLGGLVIAAVAVVLVVVAVGVVGVAFIALLLVVAGLN